MFNGETLLSTADSFCDNFHDLMEESMLSKANYFEMIFHCFKEESLLSTADSFCDNFHDLEEESMLSNVDYIEIILHYFKEESLLSTADYLREIFVSFRKRLSSVQLIILR